MIRTIDLKYGRTSIAFEFDEAEFEVLEQPAVSSRSSDAELGRLIEQPIDSPPIDDVIRPGDRVLLVVPDATRQSGCAQVVNLMVRRLIANGTRPADINIIIATGIHRAATAAEKSELLTPFIFQRIKTLDHDAMNPVRNFRVGEIAGGIPVELDWVLTECDHVVLIGSVTFHYFAGFTGGRKLICPGLASSRTIEATHRLAFDCERRTRADGAKTGNLKGNPVHEAFMEAASKVPIAFAVNTIVNDDGEITDLYAGDWKASHQRACEAFAAKHTRPIISRRDLVIAGCGGYPLDINLIQAHKALEAAAQACRDGGTIILVAECADGLGRPDLLKWFEHADSESLAIALCERYEVNGQTAWSLLKKAERFNVRIVTSLDDQAVRKMRLQKITATELASSTWRKNGGYLIPAASKMLIEC